MPTLDTPESASQLVERYGQTYRGEYAIKQDALNRFLSLCELADLMVEEQDDGAVTLRLDPHLSPHGFITVETDDLIVQGGRKNPFFSTLPNADVVQFFKSRGGTLLTRFAVQNLWVKHE